MISIKNKNAFASMIETGKRLASVFLEFENLNLIGLSTKNLDNLIFNFLTKNNLISKAKGYKGFPGYTCISINNELVHGVPSEFKIISDNDLVKIDICASYKGYCADMARMYTTNKSNEIYKNFIDCGNSCMEKAFLEVFDGNFLGNLGHKIETEIKKFNFSVVKDFCGHGIGKNMHEEPEVLNWGEPKTGIKLRYGMAIAIEPMFCQKKANLYIDEIDKWTAKTIDNGIAGHIEDTIIIGENGPIVTTRF